jgi:hypothetical protein
MMPNKANPVIVLSSGQSLKVSKVVLYDAKEVYGIAALRANALKNLGGISTGVGFIGSPEWALGGAAALGLVEGLLSAGMKKQGLEMLQQVKIRSEKLARNGKLIEFHQIQNLEVPDPLAWSAIDVSIRMIIDPSGARLRAQWNRHPLARFAQVDVQDEEIEERTETQFVHDGSEFVSLEADAGLVKVRWSSVVAYYPAEFEALGNVEHADRAVARPTGR